MSCTCAARTVSVAPLLGSLGSSCQLLAEWVAKGVALGSALDQMLDGSSVAESFAEFAAHGEDTLKAGLDGMKEALAEGENAGLAFMTQFVAALLAHKTTPVQPQPPAAPELEPSGCQAVVQFAALRGHVRDCRFAPSRCAQAAHGCTWTGPKHSVGVVGRRCRLLVCARTGILGGAVETACAPV